MIGVVVVIVAVESAQGKASQLLAFEQFGT
jgi:hypothetical protein